MATMTLRRIAALASIAALLIPTAPFADDKKENHGSFVGDVVSKVGPGNGQMTLVQPFAYIDPKSKRWDVPKDTIIDGASIPRIFWTAIGSPFTGPYLKASVVHDHFCVVRSEPWKAVHRMFYDAMLAGGTPRKQAKVMYYAVYVGGPRWETVVYKNHPPRAFPKPGDKDEVKLDNWDISFNEAVAQRDIQTIDENTSLEDIEALADRAFSGRKPPAEVRTDLQ